MNTNSLAYFVGFSLTWINFLSCHGSLTGTQHSTTVALPGTVLNFTCECQGLIILVFNNTFLANGNSEGDRILADHGISFEHYEDATGSQNGYNIKIVASYKNSGTFFSCHYVSGHCPSSEHHLHTVSGK